MVYLIHFHEKLHHAQHYIGSADAGLVRRIKQHRNGSGAKILEALNQKGIKYSVVRTWEGGVKLERKLKRWKKAKQLCPICNPDKNYALWEEERD